MNVLTRSIQRNGSGGAQAPKAPSRRIPILSLSLLIGGIVVAALIVVLRLRAASTVGYMTAPVARKDLVQTVTASGTVNPQDTILVGTQVSGTITSQNADYNTVVKSGQVLTRIDPTSFKAQLDSAESAEGQSRSSLAASLATAVSAQSNVSVAHENVAASREGLESAQSQISKTKAALDLADLTVARDRQLLGQGFIAKSQDDADVANAVAARSAYEASVITVRQTNAQLQAQMAAESASQAQATSAEATAAANRQLVGVQHAAVDQARYNFDNTVIRSQVNGTVIARNITIGQTVAASFQTPTLFTIGRDLTKMEVDVSVGEPDIGGVQAGDIADFTVLAYPNRTFHGIVYQVRQNPTTVNNVVTYDTVVYVQNRDGALYPGMTANASIHVAKAMRALVVPIAALQWAPAATQGTQAAPTRSTRASPWGMTDASLTRTILAGRDGRVFVLQGDHQVRIPVHVLLVSDTEAAVSPISANLAANDSVITSDTTSQMASQQSAASSALAARAPSQLGPPSGTGR